MTKPDPVTASDCDERGTSEEHRRATSQDEAGEAVVLSDLLVEEVSIDGMCGVY
jgi:mycofactocin precursor